MRRVRIVFALLALLLLGAAGILVQRAVSSVEGDRDAQRSTLAARVFDEMELALSEFLGSEESVSFGNWLSPPQPDPPFVSARFELVPGSAPRLSPGAPAKVGPLLTAWAERRALAPAESPGAAGSAAGAQRPGVSEEKAVAKDSEPTAPRREQDSVYDALQSLNRGAENRMQRARKLEAMGDSDRPAALPAVPAPPPERAAGGITSVAPPATSPRIAVDPLLGDRLDGERLLLARTVLAGDHGYRQGLVLDADALGAWLRARALGGDALSGASLAFQLMAGAGRVTPEAGAFAHRFAEPFDALAASLSLPALPAAGSADTVLRLSLLLVAAGGAGLFALYRMVIVALRYAEQRSNFVAAVSHELKTPLTAIRMYGEMLRDGLVPSEDKRAEYYRTITAESERLSRLIDNVLEFARTERGERPLALRAGALDVEVARLVAALRPHAAEMGFSLEISAAPGLPDVRFDRDSVAQILVNLVDNALKYARAAARCEVRIECAAAGPRVALRVRDYGPGVAPRELGRVFELFHRGESELTRTTRGTGLGLALVRSLAQRMGAQVSARNVESGGFEVSVLFPVASGSTAADPSP